MYLSSQQRRLALPESLRTQMFAFRRRVWAVKLIEACCGAAFGVLVAYLATFLLDRVWGYSRAGEIESRTVDVHVRRLRVKLGPEGRRILTVKSVGYRLDPES